MLLTFPIGSGNWLKEWQPDWTEIPEPIVAWRTGKLTYGKNGWMHIPWIRFAYQSTTAVILTLYTDAGAGVPGAGVESYPAIDERGSRQILYLGTLPFQTALP